MATTNLLHWKIVKCGFDGSSTLQADGSDSDCMLKPVAIYPDVTRENAFLVMSEVMLPDERLTHQIIELLFLMTMVFGLVLSKSTFFTKMEFL